MIITQIIGGLGNQMFQYAAGRALSLKNKSTLALDVSGYESYGLHQGFELSRVFGIQCKMAAEADVRKLLGWQSHSLVRRLLSHKQFAGFIRRRFVVEPHFDYWSGITELLNDCYLSGYWQSEKYFAEVANQIRADFSFRMPLGKQNADLANQIEQVNAISLHVRRCDYANNPKTKATHGLCSLDYYQASVRQMAQKVARPYFFIFSDDMDWVQGNLKIDFPCICVEHNRGAESYNDMRLMSLCKHHIIANSSFSWWGAWLNPNMEKLVIAPRKWFASQTAVPDLFPVGWIIL